MPHLLIHMLEMGLWSVRLSLLVPFPQLRVCFQENCFRASVFLDSKISGCNLRNSKDGGLGVDEVASSRADPLSAGPSYIEFQAAVLHLSRSCHYRASTGLSQSGW